MERRVRAERGPSARERCGNDWHSPPVFMGRVNQMPIFRDVPEEASNRYGKLLTRLTGHTKTAKNGQNTGFLRLARPSQRRSRTWRWERKRRAALLSFSVCLVRAGILVNSRSDLGLRAAPLFRHAVCSRSLHHVFFGLPFGRQIPISALRAVTTFLTVASATPDCLG